MKKGCKKIEKGIKKMEKGIKKIKKTTITKFKPLSKKTIKMIDKIIINEIKKALKK